MFLVASPDIYVITFISFMSGVAAASPKPLYFNDCRNTKKYVLGVTIWLNSLPISNFSLVSVILLIILHKSVP